MIAVPASFSILYQSLATNPLFSSMSTLLFSIDLEEFYPAHPGLENRATSVRELVDRYLELLSRHGAYATFFVVGELARKYPDVLRHIAAAGHELGCHGDLHRTLDEFDRNTFATDLQRNRKAVEDAVGVPVEGFRAPLLSLTSDRVWAYEVLAQEGFRYSSSVLPASNPLYGWPGFGTSVRQISGVWEIPITLSHLPFFVQLPLYCGTYFRVLPWWLVQFKLKRDRSYPFVTSYFHPYDIDFQQPWTMHRNAGNNPLHNALLFWRRKSLLRRMNGFFNAIPQRETYRQYVSRLCSHS